MTYLDESRVSPKMMIKWRVLTADYIDYREIACQADIRVAKFDRFAGVIGSAITVVNACQPILASSSDIFAGRHRTLSFS